jgi:hypothetical protein
LPVSTSYYSTLGHDNVKITLSRELSSVDSNIALYIYRGSEFEPRSYQPLRVEMAVATPKIIST